MDDKRENFVVKVGPLFRKVLDKQRDNIRKETYEVCDSSDWEAGEILAKKLINNNLI